MTSLKPVVRWSYNQNSFHKTCSSSPIILPKHPALINSKSLNSKKKYCFLINRSRPFMDRAVNMMSSKASLGDFDCTTSELYDDRTGSTDHHIHPWSSLKDEEEEEEDINSQKLDQWVRDSAIEIVNNLGEAPFLVHIYCNDESTPPNKTIKTVKEKAVADKWPMIERRWKGGSRTPNGVILVEQLKTPLDFETKTTDQTAKVSCSSSSTKLWGILIQGKGKSCTACYLLKTSQVRGVAGLCTHFCLFRVDCFLEHADIQLRKLWLQMA